MKMHTPYSSKNPTLPLSQFNSPYTLTKGYSNDCPSFGIDRVMLFSVGTAPADNLMTLMSIADTQVHLGGDLLKFMNSIRSEAEMNQMILVNHVGEMDSTRLDQDLLPHIQRKYPGKQVAATCVKDPTNANVTVLFRGDPRELAILQDTAACLRTFDINDRASFRCP